MDHESLAHRIFAQIVDLRGNPDADLFLARVIAELLETSPVAHEHISDLVLADLVESLHSHGQAGKDAAKLVGIVQRHWANERG